MICKYKFYYVWISLIFLLYITVLYKCDIFTSTVQMENLVNIEKRISNWVDLYLETEANRLTVLKELSENISFTTFKNSEEAKLYLSNPVNVFHLFKRLSIDILPIMTLMESKSIKLIFDQTANLTNLSLPLIIPNEFDFTGVALALNRLAVFYNISVRSLIQETFIPQSIKSAKQITAEDCYDIGQILFKNGNFSDSIKWFEEALNPTDSEENTSLNRSHILQYLSYSYFKDRNYEAAIKTAEDFLKLDPHNQTMENNLMYYRISAAVREKNPTPKTYDNDENVPEHRTIFAKLCRNERVNTLKEISKLHCYYFTNNSSYLILQPAKIEVVNLHPWVSVIHDLVRDNEINYLIKYAIPKLTRARVGGFQDAGDFSESRISKFAWILDSDPVTANIKKRLEKITGLDIFNCSEPFQMNNYGVGGFYEIHHDYAGVLPDTEFHEENGDRLATVLIYLSDVLAGGGTSFPNLGITVFPTKGSAVFWYNLLKSGLGNPYTFHGGCPVLLGVKWVANVWIRQYPQTFKLPCGKRKHEMFLNFK